MAAGKTSMLGPDEEKKGSLTCSLCLEIFTCPKALPCLHTFCLKCLENLASHHYGSFLCPQCRSRVTVPSGGVANFPTNFHIRDTDLARARNEDLCGVHPENSMEFYCADCQEPVCSYCILTKHKPHETMDLQEAGNKARLHLKESQGRVLEAVSYLEGIVDANNEETKSLKETTAKLEVDVRTKHALLVLVANKCRDDVLASLSAINADIDHRVTKDVNCSRDNLDQVCQLQEQLHSAISSGSDIEVLAVAKEMREGRGSTDALSELKSAKRSSICRPVLVCKATEEAITPFVQDYFGTVEERQRQFSKPQVQHPPGRITFKESKKKVNNPFAFQSRLF